MSRQRAKSGKDEATTDRQAAHVPSRAAHVSPTVSNARSLQRTVGNRATTRLLSANYDGGLGRFPVATALVGQQPEPRVQRAPAAGCASAGCGEVVQRHSSWEHSLLGDAKPDVLAQIGTWQDATGPKLLDSQKVDVTVPGVGTFDKGQVMHVLAQEMTRIKQWQDAPPEVASTDDPYQKTKKDPTYDVFVVRLPAEDASKSMLITYGELNTLADFYGDIETMKTAAPKQRRQIVQSVRKETFLRLKQIYKKIEDSLSDAESRSGSVTGAQGLYEAGELESASFAGSAAVDFISSVKGQADLLAGDKPLIGQGTGAKGDVNKYGATLARNACHFVPRAGTPGPATTARPGPRPSSRTTTS